MTPGVGRRILNIAHRGGSLTLPENTLPAFLKARELGADGVELDVQETQDGEFLVIHDSCIGGRLIGSMTADDVIRACSTRPNSLVEVLDGLREWRQAEVFVELKDVRSLGRLRDLLHGYEEELRLHVVSFNAEIVIALRALDAEMSLGLIGQRITPQLERDLIAANGDCLLLRWPGILFVGTRRFSRSAVSVLAWTVNDQFRARACVLARVDGIISDRPDRIARVLDSKEDR